MALQLGDFSREPASRAFIHIYDEAGSSMLAGDRIQVRYQPDGGDIEVLMDEIVPAGKVWNDIQFQFQANEDDA